MILDFIDNFKKVRRKHPTLSLDEQLNLALACRPRSYCLSFQYALPRMRAFRALPKKEKLLPRYRRWRDLSSNVAVLEHRYHINDRRALERELSTGSPATFHFSLDTARRAVSKFLFI